jgi:hypothetical protein
MVWRGRARLGRARAVISGVGIGDSPGSGAKSTD